jgi:energy-coupling factor transport system permease protein
MIRDITLGQYYPGDSWIHKLDPRTKIISVFVFIISLFIVNDFWGFLIATLVLGVTIGISKVPLKFILRGLKPIFIIIIFTFVINMFMTKGTTLIEIGFLTITREGLYRALFMAARLILLIIGSSLLTFTTKPINLTDGIEKLLNPLRRFGVPVTHVFSVYSYILLSTSLIVDEHWMRLSRLLEGFS